MRSLRSCCTCDLTETKADFIPKSRCTTTASIPYFEHVFESAVVVAVGGEVVRYLFCDLQPVENASPVLRQVCDRIVRLWQVKNKLEVMQHFLETYYQWRLDFGQVDLVVLEAIENYFRKT